eukprot:1645457-Rhodomonas_salina.2
MLPGSSDGSLPTSGNTTDSMDFAFGNWLRSDASGFLSFSSVVASTPVMNVSVMPGTAAESVCSVDGWMAVSPSVGGFSAALTCVSTLVSCFCKPPTCALILLRVSSKGMSRNCSIVEAPKSESVPPRVSAAVAATSSWTTMSMRFLTLRRASRDCFEETAGMLPPLIGEANPRMGEPNPDRFGVVARAVDAPLCTPESVCGIVRSQLRLNCMH